MMMWIAAALLVLIAAFFLVGPARVWRQVASDPDMGAQSPETLQRTGKPNDALLGPAEALSVRADAQTPVFDVPPTELFETLLARIDAAQSIRWVERDPTGLYARGITRSPLMKFPDTSHIWALPSGDDQTKSSLVLYAAAQLGHSDLGKNRQRLDSWLGLLDDLPKAL